MIAFRPDSRWKQNTTCSCSMSPSENITSAPRSRPAGCRTPVAERRRASRGRCEDAGVRASPAAALRIYEPLAAFPPDERLRWERAARSRPVSNRGEGARRERELTVAAAVRRRLDPVPSGGSSKPGSAPDPGQAETGPGGGVDADQAFTQRVDGLLYVCPWRLQIR